MINSKSIAQRTKYKSSEKPTGRDGKMPIPIAINISIHISRFYLYFTRLEIPRYSLKSGKFQSTNRLEINHLITITKKHFSFLSGCEWITPRRANFLVNFCEIGNKQTEVSFKAKRISLILSNKKIQAWGVQVRVANGWKWGQNRLSAYTCTFGKTFAARVRLEKHIFTVCRRETRISNTLDTFMRIASLGTHLHTDLRDFLSGFLIFYSCYRML